MEFPTYGTGLRIKVESENNIILRFDPGWGAGSLHGVYLNFGEVF
ncbi:MAG TPA: hypothetical protein PLE78_09410 [Flavobacteriales bacterium]|nr:hypothetical protein [Flavobacteriales bacterium]HQW41424.1 hypothetical protein [Flavobacteriales bacterium]